MVPLLSIILPRNLRSIHKDIRVQTKTTMKMISMKMISANRVLAPSETSHSDTQLPGKIRLMSHAMAPPMISHRP